MKIWLKKVAKELKGARKVIILGIGNVQRGDDGAGVRVVELLGQKTTHHSSIKVINAGEAPENYTGPIRNYGPTHVIIIDACKGGKKPGSVYIVDISKIVDSDISTHRMPLTLLAGFLEKTAHCKVLVIGIEPQLVGWYEGMSAVVSISVRDTADSLSTALSKTLKLS